MITTDRFESAVSKMVNYCFLPLAKDYINSTLYAGKIWQKTIMLRHVKPMTKVCLRPRRSQIIGETTLPIIWDKYSTASR